MTDDTAFKVGDVVTASLPEYDPFYAGYHLKHGTIVSTEEPDSHYTRGTGYRVLFEDGTTVRMLGYELSHHEPEPIQDTPAEAVQHPLKDLLYTITVDMDGLEELMRIVALHAWNHEVSDPVRHAILNARTAVS